MKKQRCKWLSLMVLSIATLLVMSGCGGSGGGGTTSAPPAASVAKVSGTVTFPTSASVSLSSLGKRVPKSVALELPDTTIELRDLTGKLIATTTAVATDAGTYEYSFPNVALADYVIKAIRGNTIMKAIVDKGSLTADATKTRNIDTASTTAVIVAEQKMNVTPGTIGETVTAADAAKITTAAIANISPQALENAIYNAIGVVTGSSPGTASASDIALMNLINIITAAVNKNVNPSGIVAGTVAPPADMTTTQYTAGNVATGGVINTVIVPATVTATATASAAVEYVAPPVGSVAFTGKVTEPTSSTPLAGVAVTTNELKTFTDPNGYFTLVGIPKDTLFIIKMSMSGKTDSYSSQLSISANTDASDRPFSLLTLIPSAWGNSPGKGVIISRVVVSSNLGAGFIDGVVVTATDSANAAVYSVDYMNTSDIWDTTLTGTATNGIVMIKNVPAGRTVNVTATKAGYTFDTIKFVTVADAVCQGRLTGTVAPVVVVPPDTTTASALKASLVSGWYEFRDDSVYDATTNTHTRYYYIERIGLAADGLSLTSSVTSYLDPVSKTWTTTKPAGFSTNSSGFKLTSSGWVTDSEGPEGYTIVFNADGTAVVTDPSGLQGKISLISSTSIAGLTYSNGPALLSTNALYPAGSVVHNISFTNLTDEYYAWPHYQSNSISTLDAVPAAFTENNPTWSSIYIHSNSETEYFNAQYVSGSTTNLNVYKGTRNSGGATKVGTATAVRRTVLGQEILEIVIDSSTLATYSSYALETPFMTIINGVLMDGDYKKAGYIDYDSEGELNEVSMNHLKTFVLVNQLPVNKPVVKNVSKAILGR